MSRLSGEPECRFSCGRPGSAKKKEPCASDPIPSTARGRELLRKVPQLARNDFAEVKVQFILVVYAQLFQTLIAPFMSQQEVYNSFVQLDEFGNQATLTVATSVSQPDQAVSY